MTAQALTVAESVSRQQREIVDAIGFQQFSRPTTAEEFLAVAQWLELEAGRGYPSDRSTLWCAENMRLAAARRESGEAHPWTQGADEPVQRCPACNGPVNGARGCGGPVATRESKWATRTVCGGSARAQAAQAPLFGGGR